MNKINRFLAVFVVTVLAVGLAEGSFVNDSFERSNGVPVTNDQWRATDLSVIVTNKNKPLNGSPATQAAMIPIFKTLTNDVALDPNEGKVWTDFWTIPRPFVSAVDAAPAVDSSLSAMFFVSNGTWVVVYGQGVSIVTNASSEDIWLTPHVAINDGSTWHRVSVLHDYTNQTWSLFIDGSPLRTNMAFISSTPVPNYQWFSVQNGGGASSNTTWIDDVLVTNRVPASLTNDHHNDGVRDAWELMYYGTIGVVSSAADPDGDGFNNSQESVLGSNPGLGGNPSEPGGTNLMEYVFNAQSPGIVMVDITNATSPAIQLNFSVGSNRTCTVQGSSTPNFSGLVSNMPSFSTGPNGETKFFVDPNALVVRPNPYYYRVIATSPEGLSVTNAEIYAVYRQSRVLQPSVSNFWVGITIDYGESNTLASTLGQQLARGLSGHGDAERADRVTVYNPDPTVFYLDGDRNWVKLGVGSVTVNTRIGMGHALLVQRLGLGASDGAASAVFAGPKVTNTSVAINVNSGWNFLSWPYEGSNNTWKSTFGNLNDAIWLYRDNVPTGMKKLVRYSDGWHLDKQGGVPLTGSYSYLKYGEGFFYTNAAAGGTWTP
jgi:hypothetical protein